jgi:hypothetical protein
LGITLDPARFEYVSCIYVEDSEKFLQSQNAQTAKAVKKFDPDLVKHWIYIPHSETIKLHHDQKHFSKKLTDLLLQGFQLENLHSRERYDLSFYLNMHPYRFLIFAVIGHCYDQNLHNEVDDPKIIKKQDIVNYLHRKIPLSASDDEKKALITKKVEQIIHYGEKYDLFEILSDDSIKIKSMGVQLNVVKKHLKTKFFERWIEEKAEERCQKRALEKFEEKYYNENYRRLDYFDPSINK